MIFSDKSNQRFGRLYVLEFVGRDHFHRALWRCLCDCGKIVIVAGGQLTTGKTKSCGCLHLETVRRARKHGCARAGKKSYIYHVWVEMNARCSNPRHHNWDCYGGRGITVCKRWRNSFENFYADMGDPPSGLTLERINNDLGYDPGNCCWATRKKQAQNRREYLCHPSWRLS